MSDTRVASYTFAKTYRIETVALLNRIFVVRFELIKCDDLKKRDNTPNWVATVTDTVMVNMELMPHMKDSKKDENCSQDKRNDVGESDKGERHGPNDVFLLSVCWLDQFHVILQI